MTEAAPGFEDDEDRDVVHCDLCGWEMLPLFAPPPSEVNTNTEARHICTVCKKELE